MSNEDEIENDQMMNDLVQIDKNLKIAEELKSKRMKLKPI